VKDEIFVFDKGRGGCEGEGARGRWERLREPTFCFRATEDHQVIPSNQQLYTEITFIKGWESCWGGGLNWEPVFWGIVRGGNKVHDVVSAALSLIWGGLGA